MAAFSYRALKSDGSVVEGRVEGASKGEVIRSLATRGLQLVSIEEAGSVDLEEKRSVRRKRAAGADGMKRDASQDADANGTRRLSGSHLIQFTEEVSDLLSAGVQLDSALESIAKRSESPDLRAVAQSCFERVREGSSLASALGASSGSFSSLYCNLVSAGEVSGALGDILKRQVRYLVTLSELQAKLITALIYPMFLVVSGIAVTGMFVFFLIPRLERLIDSTGGTLPPLAALLVGSAELVREYGIVLAVVAALAGFLFFLALRSPAYRRTWDRLVLRLPFFGKLVRTRFNVQFVETLANLLNNGMPLVRSLELVEGTAANLHLRDTIREIVDQVSEGSSLHRAMERGGVFDSGLIDMVRIGEDTGQLAGSMNKAGVRLDREFSRAIDRIASLVQPLIILIMALVVGIMAYVMISVVYDTIGMLRGQ